MEQIKQIIPAEGWAALFVFRNEDTGGIDLHVERLACWALVDRDGEQFVGGYSATDGLVEEGGGDPHFVTYFHAATEVAEAHLEEAERRLRLLEEREAKRARLRVAGYRYGTSRGMPRWLSPFDNRWLCQKDALQQLEEMTVV